MAGSPWSSSSSCTSSLGSLDEDIVCVVRPDAVSSSEGGGIKFLCSYGGRILPRQTDGALRYVGGDNRVLSVDRCSLHFYELQRKLREMCGWDDVSLRCQLPTEDLDALVSVTSDDDLANLLEEYDAASRDRLQPLKIRAFLFPRTPTSPPPYATTKQLSSRPSPNLHQQRRLHRKNSSSPDAGAGRVSPPACAPWWWAASRSPRSIASVAHQPQPARPHRPYLVINNGSYWQ